MAELSTYDKGYSIYISKLSLKKLPLICWNFYSEFTGLLNASLSDQRQLNQMAVAHQWQTPFQLSKMMQHDTVVVVTCPKLKIVYATQNIVHMNGYQPSEVLGKSPKMFK